MNDVVLNLFSCVDFCYSLGPTQPYVSFVAANANPSEDGNVTVLVSNCTTAHHTGAMLIKPMHAVTDTGATSVFIMDGIPTKNRQLAVHPIQINLPDGRRVTSSHICNINISGLPITLLGHIIPDLTMASLLGIRVLCKARCIVVFNDKTCCKYFKVKLILTGYKDPTNDLWMLPIGQDKLWTTPASNSEDPRMHKILLSHLIECNNVPACAATVQEQPSAYVSMRKGH